MRVRMEHRKETERWGREGNEQRNTQGDHVRRVGQAWIWLGGVEYQHYLQRHGCFCASFPTVASAAREGPMSSFLTWFLEVLMDSKELNMARVSLVLVSR